MPSLGRTSYEPKNRSGWSWTARVDVLRSKCTPSIAFSIPKWSISPSTTATGSASSSMSSGTPLNMYSTGNSISLDSSSMSPARRKPYQSFLWPSGTPIMRSMTPMSDGKVMPSD